MSTRRAHLINNMFKPRNRSLIIPQREHARLAGNIAVYWGNERFHLPRIPLSTVIKGITFHQNGYELIDTHPVIEMSDDTLVKVLRNDFNVQMSDIEAELISMFHQFRLVSKRLITKPSEEFVKLQKEFEIAIENKLARSKYSKGDFLWADRITNLCDRISFNFSFGEEITEIIPIYSKVGSEEKVEIKQTLKGENTIELDKWPFSSKQIRNVVIAYESEDYPKTLRPVLLEFKLIPKRK